MPRRSLPQGPWQTPEPAAPTVSYVDPYRDRNGFGRNTSDERRMLRIINQRIAAKPTLEDVMDFLFLEAPTLIPCDRMSLAFIEEDGRRIVAHQVRTKYDQLQLTPGYTEDLHNSSLAAVLETGTPRIIGDLAQYAGEHPQSRSTERLLREGVRSSLTCPLVVEGRVLGFMFRNTLEPNAYTRRHVELQMSISERLSQAVEKAWRIEQLEEVNRAYLEMLGFVSHELKSPVASMVTDAQLLAGGYLGELSSTQKLKLERLIHKGEYLLELVREYLDLARVEGQELHAEFKPNVRLEDDVIAPSIELVRPQFDERDMTVEIDSTQTPRAMADCDPTLLRIVFVNLLTNAARYGREGGRVVVRIAAERTRVTVRVWNEGRGFTAADKAKLFRRFSRIKREGDPRRGSGLGLYNSWRIIQLHHGRIRANSAPGEWAEFTIELPQPLPPIETPADAAQAVGAVWPARLRPATSATAPPLPDEPAAAGAATPGNGAGPAA
ncbi:MAG: GAF domain-containing sensor histidine kinase [Thermoleophilia bacterium]|nr:GAF domain-containing sensor histidine kinase [Thermoleophilia bacterium]